MARSRSVPTSKASPTNSNKEQTSASNPAKLPDVKPIAEGITPAEVAAEARITPEPRKLEVVKTEPRKNVVAPVNRFQATWKTKSGAAPMNSTCSADPHPAAKPRIG